MKKICSKCKEEKDITEFKKRKNSKDGHEGVCKKCEKERIMSREKIVVASKICTQCNKEKDINNFRKNSKSIDGYASMCKECFEKKYLVVKTCDMCGCNFKTRHSETRFCSKECVAEYQKDRVYYNCDYCGKESFERKTEYNRYKNHYCSKECKDKHRSYLYVGENAPMYGKEGLKGENSPHWKPELTQEHRENKRLIDGYYDFIKGVYDRDNYTCQCCGTVGNGKNLNAHHLNGYNWDIENRTNIDNGITLCETCHNNFHNTYGRGDNTKEQFEKWINNKENKSA